MAYGYCYTARGWQLIGELIASAQETNEAPLAQLSRISFGKGVAPEGTNPADLTDLVEFVANGSSTKPLVEIMRRQDGSVQRATISFVVEYASNKNGAELITELVNLKEFGIFTIDKQTNEEVLLYYADISDAPHLATPFSQGAIDIHRFPVSMVFTDELEVEILYPPLAFMTAKDVADYAEITCKPIFLDLAQRRIDIHNLDPYAHPDIQRFISSNKERIEALEKMLGGQGSTSFWYDFASLFGIELIRGVWNAEEMRIEF